MGYLTYPYLPGVWMLPHRFKYPRIVYFMGESSLKKHLISLMVLFLLVSVMPFINAESTSDTAVDSLTAQEDYYQYMADWSVHLTNQSNIEDSSRPVYYNQESNGDGGPIPLSGPMDSAWPMHGHDVFHTGRSFYSTENNSGIEVWRVRGVETGAVWSSAIIDKIDMVYFGTKGADGALYALYPNGTRKWRYGIDGAIWGTPAIADNGDIYCTTWGGSGYLYSITKNGTERWYFDPEIGTVSAPTIGQDGTVYFGTDGHNIFAVNPDGTEKWRYTTGYIVMGSPAIAHDDTIYIGSGDHFLYALYPNGTLRWMFETGDEIKGSASIATDGTIYIPSFDGYLYALYPNGTMKWQASTGDSIAAAGIALAEDGTIYIGTEQLRAYYPNGTLKWIIDVQGAIYGTVPAVSADGTIYINAGDSLVAVNPNGSEKWRKQLTTAQIRSSPSIGPVDRVYVGSEDPGVSPYGYLHAFGTIENNQPPEKPTIDGPAQAKIRTSVTYVFQANDTDNTPISYYVDWGDDTNEQTMDYMPGFAASLEHTWMKKGTYTIKAKAIDTFGLESDWATLTVIMPYEPSQFPFLTWLLERYPNAFPILRYLLGWNKQTYL
jgi:hypothetical protein